MRLLISPGFVRNDPEYAPFGIASLRGITPARLAVVALVCAISWAGYWVVYWRAGGFWIAFAGFMEGWGRIFVAAVPAFVLIIAVERTSRGPAPRRVAALAAAVVIAAMLFAVVASALRLLHGIGNPQAELQYRIANFLRAATLGGLFAALMFFVTRRRDAARALQRERLARADIERQTAEARLHLLRAQIEPHFLFNCLASVRRLYETRPAEGRTLLVHLIEYLRMALPTHRVDFARVDEEAALARRFLEIFSIRLGTRLAVAIDIAADVGSARIPPLIVASLIENAIKHGIGPRAGGGEVALRAWRDGVRLIVEVSDDGVGFREHFGTGVGLANARARLQTLFHGAASLDLSTNAAGGITARMSLPYRDCDAMEVR